MDSEKCRGCGKPATTICSYATFAMCGEPLCDDCTWIDGFPHGHGPKCPPTPAKPRTSVTRAEVKTIIDDAMEPFEIGDGAIQAENACRQAVEQLCQHLGIVIED